MSLIGLVEAESKFVLVTHQELLNLSLIQRVKKKNPNNNKKTVKKVS